MNLSFIRLLVTAAACGMGPLALASPFVDVLNVPAQMAPLAPLALMQSVVRAGDRLIAAGQRGEILVSKDGGVSWKQSPVPVSSDLTALYFVDPANGWAVGHDGVVLHTQDGGDTWRLQLDGRKANDLLVAAMTREQEAEPSSDTAKKLLTEAQRYRDEGPDKPFLDVWFADARHGYVVGAYNLIFRTADGGDTWESLFSRTDNPKFFNLYGIRPVAGTLYVAGEGGLVIKLDPASERFQALQTGYAGSFFGLAEAGNSLLVFGLRGTVYRSDDAGATWTQVDTGLTAAVIAATHTSNGATLLADSGGRVAASDDGGHTFRSIAIDRTVPLAGLAEAAAGRLALAGPRGLTIGAVTQH